MIRTVVVVCSVFAMLWTGASARAQESFYFVDAAGEGTSTLFTLEIDGCEPGKARIEPLPVGPEGDGVVPYNNVVAVAADPSGEQLCFIDSGPEFPIRNMLVCVDLSSGVLSDPLPVLPVDPEELTPYTIFQAAFSPDGTLYFTSSGREKLYTLDTATGGATSLGKVCWDVDGSQVDIQGADLAFASDGELFLFTNNTADDGAPNGLYRLTLPGRAGDPVVGTFLGAGQEATITGMAVLDGGLGDLLLSEESPGTGMAGELLVLDRDTGAELDRFEMANAGCTTYFHATGDLSNGALRPAECFLVVGDGPGTAPLYELGHLFQTQVGPTVQESLPVLLDLTPEFPLPTLAGQALAQGGAASAAAPKVPRWMRDGDFSVQVVMWNPSVFPGMPEQFTAGLYVQVQADGSVVATPYGDDQGGLEIWHEVTTDDDGQPVIRFPFSIPGF